MKSSLDVGSHASQSIHEISEYEFPYRVRNRISKDGESLALALLFKFWLETNRSYAGKVIEEGDVEFVKSKWDEFMMSSSGRRLEILGEVNHTEITSLLGYFAPYISHRHSQSANAEAIRTLLKEYFAVVGQPIPYEDIIRSVLIG